MAPGYSSEQKGAIDTMENTDDSNNWKKTIPIPPYLKSVTYGMNRLLTLLFFISPLHLIGAGLFFSILMPTKITLALSTLLFLYPLAKQALRYYNWLPVPYANEIISTTYTARCDGDFVVFLIGARPNGANPFTKAFFELGKAFQSMVAELESDPSLGYMGGDMYVGANDRKSTSLHVQYWRDYESLQRWTHTKMGLHFKTMMNYRKTDQNDASYGIWHETYKVRDGEYEVIYGNMPPIGLALATTAVPETKSNNGPGRMQRRNKEKQTEPTVNGSHQD